MGQIKFTSGTDLAIRLVLVFVALNMIAAIAAVVDLPVRYVLSSVLADTEIAAFVVALVILIVCVAVMPGDADNHMAALSTFVYVLRVHKIALSWKDSIAVSNLFANNAYSTWYPLTDVAKLPRNQRRDAIIFIARKTGRFIDPPSSADIDRQWRKKRFILILTSLAWLVFIGYGAIRQSVFFDILGFLSMGGFPVLFFWVGLAMYRQSKARKQSHGSEL